MATLGRSSNPVLGKNTFNARTISGSVTNVMTLQGTVNKVFMMLGLVILAAFYTWNLFFQAGDMQSGANAVVPWLAGGGIGGFIFALITVFKRSWAPFTAPVYAVLEGLFLGGISAFFEAQYPGIVIQAVGLTFGTLFSLLFAYKTGLIKATENFKLGVVAATGGIFLVYFVTFILNLFGVNVGFIHGNGIVAIGFSIFVVIIAALNLVLDFDFIEQGAEASLPKYMEWYAAFGLIVTLIWLYIEFLRLLAKLNSRR
ncbi:MAG: Bax inhibitor-1/YccA family membrane protein [Bacteroidota bacterium]